MFTFKLIIYFPRFGITPFVVGLDFNFPPVAASIRLQNLAEGIFLPWITKERYDLPTPAFFANVVMSNLWLCMFRYSCRFEAIGFSLWVSG